MWNLVTIQTIHLGCAGFSEAFQNRIAARISTATTCLGCTKTWVACSLIHCLLQVDTLSSQGVSVCLSIIAVEGPSDAARLAKLKQV